MIKKKLGLVLSGGGARGIAHIGVLKALEELEMKPDIVSGTSSGAIIGAFYACGYSADEIKAIIISNSIFHLSDIALNSSALFKTKANEAMYDKYFEQRHFSDLKTPLYIATTDLLTGSTIFYSSGELAKAVIASSAIPVLFEPVRYGNRLLIDGCCTCSFPTEPLVGTCDLLIGVHTNPAKKIATMSGMMNILDRSIHLSYQREVLEKVGHCDLFIEPPQLNNYGMFDFKKVNEIVDIGYYFTHGLSRKLLSLKKLIDPLKI
ncbi:MAG TPA: patatin-like phospholipase family protein [Bacteroidia bacterium]|nr:patatin-like phospholipase family protein [Bacteroidia bacterium]